MSNYIATDTDLTSVANAIRIKGGSSASLSFPTGFVSAINDIPTGGGGASDGDVIFIDYDGTVVDAKTKTEINAMTADSDLPANPSHTGLTAQGWNWTVAQLKAQLTAMPDQKVYVGQMYTTASGATEIDVTMRDGRLSPIMSIAVNGTVTIDWGDGTASDTITGTSTSTDLAPSHTYATAGNYTISVKESSGSTYRFYPTSSKTLLRKNDNLDQSYVYADSIKRVRFGNIQEIKTYTFYYCGALENITIPNTVTSIGSYAFQSCNSLKSVVIPNLVASISISVMKDCCSISSVSIPYTVTSIGNYAFQNCYLIAKLTIPSAVTSFGYSVFPACFSIPKLTMPSAVASIGSNQFQNCYALEKITLPSSATSIGAYAFQGCFALPEITIPSGVTKIGNFAFYACSGLEEITIPNTVTSIGSYAFQNCLYLANVVISNAVTTIGTSAFQNCHSIAKLTIPSTVTSIGATAFQYCYGVSEFHIKPTAVPTGGANMFDGIASDCVIYVPYSADHSILNNYKTASNWLAYASYMQEEPQ